jgi:TDG/mug DNA glycosylase family protein
MERIPRTRRPTRAELEAAKELLLPDLIAPNLRVLFCGINPGLYTAAIGHHFGRPGNRFWPALFAGGFTDSLVSPYDEHELLARGYGITNIVGRATARADELTNEELVKGGRAMVAKIKRYNPRIAAVLGVVAYRVAMGQKDVTVGRRPETIGETILWVLPNPSGLNAHYLPDKLARVFRELKEASDSLPRN